MRELLKRSFELWVEKIWLKEIERATDEHRKAVEKANRKLYVLQKLLEAYNERYDENLWSVKYGRRKTAD